MNVTHATSAGPSAYAATSNTGTSASAAATPKTKLGFEDFLKLLSVQFQQQDPMKPVEDTAFIAQMAQFSSLEQTTNMVNQMNQMGADQQQVIAAGYLGRTVTIKLPDGTYGAGEVTAIDNTTGTPQLVVGGQSWPLSSVVLIEPTPTPVTTESQ
ncbi:MAG TPA: flagellar hook capping FlgD N-terminal domain-containing protein [Opitutus sp.]|nr:flagellar hook capping FlgD N-terminal domain-containing protein [Opitutus sp.]